MSACRTVTRRERVKSAQGRLERVLQADIRYLLLARRYWRTFGSSICFQGILFNSGNSENLKSCWNSPLRWRGVKAWAAGAFQALDRALVQFFQAGFVQYVCRPAGAPIPLTEQHDNMAAVPGGQVDVV